MIKVLFYRKMYTVECVLQLDNIESMVLEIKTGPIEAMDSKHR